MSVSFFIKTTVLSVSMLALVACKSDADRAEDYFRSGMELIEAGDTDRAIVEFRNVFEFDNGHLPTRMKLAEIQMENGNMRGAYSQYLAAAEAHPENTDLRLTLAEIAFTIGSWDEFVRHGTVATENVPEDPRAKAVSVGLKYRQAVLDEDNPARQALTAPAEALLVTLPANAILNNVLVDSYSRDGQPGKALTRIDALIAANPDDRQQYMRRLGLLGQMQDEAGTETQLQAMVAQFPGDVEIQGMLFRFYVAQQRMDDAEQFLRSIADPADDSPALFLSLVNFVQQVHGDAAARVEIERAIAENPRPDRFRAMLAMMDFQAGGQQAQEKAIADVEAILVSADPEAEETESIRVLLARMLASTGNQVGARRVVEQLLEQNPNQVEALKMQATWQLQEDNPDAAIATLRLALDNAPEDIQTMNLMYDAYTRAGEPDLAREFLALAVDASGNSPETSLRYARVLMQEERWLPAEDVLLPALQQSPGNIDILQQLGTIYLRLNDTARATQVIDTLRRLDDERATALSNRLQADLLNQESGIGEALSYLEGLAASEDAGLQEQLNLIRAQLVAGETAAALQRAQELVTENPGNLTLKQVLANTQIAAGELDLAKISLREIIAAEPEQAVNAWLQMVQIALRQGNPEEAEALLAQALTATGNNARLMWVRATRLEQAGDIDGAIDIYETLYKQNSGAVVIANNLASLRATYREDETSLERAWSIGRRLRDIELPPIQDTYGWLLHRRGDSEEALPYLESAAEGLPEDPIVQAHLGFAYMALERNEDALKQLQKAVDIAGPVDTRDRIELAREEIGRLRDLTGN